MLKLLKQGQLSSLHYTYIFLKKSNTLYSLGRGLLDRRPLRLWGGWRLGCLWSFGLGSLGYGIGLDVVLVDVLLDVQESHLHIAGGIQQRLESRIKLDILTLLQLLLCDILIHLPGNLGARNLLANLHLQESTKLLGDVKGLVESIRGGASLCLLAVGVLNQRLHLADILADQLQLIHKISEGNVSHC